MPDLNNNILLRYATVEDMPSMASLIKADTNDPNMTAEYLDWWYFQNPNGGYSLPVCDIDGNIEGVASGINFRYLLREGGEQLITNSQNGYTSLLLRGKKMYGKLYYMGEKINFEGQKVAFIIGFSNHNSTPIFLNRFAFQRGISPAICFLPFVPKKILSFFPTFQYREVPSLDAKLLREKDLLRPLDSMVKNADYFLWRYDAEVIQKQYTRLEVKDKKGDFLGYTILKKIKRKGLPFWAVMDFATSEEQNVKYLLDAARYFLASFRGLGLLVIENETTLPLLKNTLLKWRFENRLNFVIKGKDEAHTKKLTKLNINFTFGDLDFL